MLDALVGSIIAVTATTALLLALQVSEESLNQAGRLPLNSAEIGLLRDAGYNVNPGSQDRLVLEADLRQLPSQ
jgi:hypothetical protein